MTSKDKTKYTLSLYPELIYPLLDKGAEIAAAFYIIPTNVFVLYAILNFGNFNILISLALGLLVFVIHLLLKGGEYRIYLNNYFSIKKNFMTFVRLFYVLNLSIFLVISALAFVDPVIKTQLLYLTDFFNISGGIMFMFVYMFIAIVVVSLFRRFIIGFNKKIYYRMIIILVLILFIWGLKMLESQEWTQSIGHFLLGSINLLIIKILFSPSLIK